MVYNKLRGLLSHSRVPLRIAAMNPRPTIFRVRIRREKTSFFWTTVGIFTLAMGTKMTLNSTGDEERTIFLPTSFPKPVPQPLYERDDPVMKNYHQFHDNLKRQEEAKIKVCDIAVKAFHKEQKKFGNNMKCSIMWLWFQYPPAPPPEYEQTGLVISRSGISWGVRQMHPYTFHRLKNALWPEWMANSLLSSFRRIRDTIRDEVTNAADAEPEDSDDTQSSTLSVTIPHPFYTGKVTFEETMGNFRNTLRKTWKAPPPQKGFVRVEGVIQITSEKLLVHVDVDATFNPETMKDFRFKTLKVRYVARMPEKPQSPMFKARNPKRPPPAAIEASPKAEAGDLLEGSKVAGSKIQLKETRDVANTTQNVTISSQLATQASTANTQKKSASTVVETSKSPKKRTIDSDIFEDEAATATKKPNTVTITPLPPAKQAQADNNPRKEQ